VIKLKDILDEAAKLVANTNTEAYEKYAKMYKDSFPHLNVGSKYNPSNVEGIRKWYADVKKWFVSNFGIDEKTWKQLFKAYDAGRSMGSGKISFRGKVYTMNTGMDDSEYTFDVLVEFGYIKYKQKIDPNADRKERIKRLMASLDAD
jgi:hypothetical protein